LDASPPASTALERELRGVLGDDRVVAAGAAGYSSDQTEGRGVHGLADAVVLPRSTAEVERAVSWCYEHEVPIVPRGGGTGFAGGSVPVDGGVVLSLERMSAVRSFEPLLWRIEVEAGVRTGTIHRLARENGLCFPPDPGAAEQSQIGGNLATNAGGPHAFKYGVTGAWVTGIEAVIPPGETISTGGPVRKDVSGYDLASLLVGSEGTLGVITAAWLRLLPAPEARLPLVALFEDAAAGCAAVEAVLGSGLQPAAVEYLDRGALAAAAGSFPSGLPDGGGFLLLTEADGSRAEAERRRDELRELLREQAVAIVEPSSVAEAEALWRWRDGVSLAVTARRGAKVSEDIVVPVERLREAIEGTVEVGARHGLEALSWGHAADGNLHSTFLVSPGEADVLERAGEAAEELFDLAARLGGSVSGEHGIGFLKRRGLGRHLSPPERALHERVKRAFDPKDLMNPGKKQPLP
jgi:glycolate oxidase subunit GlcD